MKSTQLLIHELELDIQGVSVAWVQQHQESIINKLVQVFNQFPENDLQLFIDYIEIDLGKFNNIAEFLLFLDLELTRFQRQIIDSQNSGLEKKLDTTEYGDFSQSEWDVVFQETKDFFNPELSSDNDKLRAKFIEISSLLQRNREQFWRWLMELGISTELIIKFRKFITNQQLPNEAIVAWITGMFVLKDKKPDQTFEKLLIQILVRNFTNSNKLSVLLKRGDDEFIQLLTGNNDTQLYNNDTSNLNESDWQYIETLINWQELLRYNVLRTEIIQQIPLPYLIKLLASHRWIEKSKFWENLSVYLINNNIFKKEDLFSPVSGIQKQNRISKIQHWLLNTFANDDTTIELHAAIVVLLSQNQSAPLTKSLIQELLKNITSNLSAEDFKLIQEFLFDVIEQLENKDHSVQSLTIEIQKILLLIRKISLSETNVHFNLLEFLKTVDSVADFSKLDNELSTNKPTDASDFKPKSIPNTQFKESDLPDFLRIFYQYIPSFVLLYGSTQRIKKLFVDLNSKIINGEIQTDKELIQEFTNSLKIKQIQLLIDSISTINKNISKTSAENKSILQWIDWIIWLSENQTLNTPVTFDFWKVNHYEKESIFSTLGEPSSLDLIEVIKNEISTTAKDDDPIKLKFTEEELRWFESFIQNIDQPSYTNSNGISRETLYFYFSLFNYLINQKKSTKTEAIELTLKELRLFQTTDSLLPIELKNDIVSNSTIEFIYAFIEKLETLPTFIEKEFSIRITNFRTHLRQIQIDTSTYPIFEIESALKGCIEKIIIDQFDYTETTTLEVPIAQYYYAVTQLFLFWQEQLAHYQKDKAKQQNQVFEISSPRLDDVIQRWKNTKILEIKTFENLPIETEKSLIVFWNNLNTIQFILQEINNLNTSTFVPDLVELFKFDFRTLISEFYQKINYQDEISASLKINFFLQNSLIKITDSINEIVRKIVQSNPILTQVINNYSSTDPRIFNEYKATLNDLYLVSLLETNYKLQNQSSLILSQINEFQQLTLTNQSTEVIYSQNKPNFNSIIFKDLNEIPLVLPIKTWTNNLESTYSIDSILIDSNLFLNLIQQEQTIPIITGDSDSKHVILRYLTKVDLIHVLFSHPRWRELHVQLMRKEGFGFKQLVNQLSISEVQLIINNKYPNSNNYNSDLNELISSILKEPYYNSNFIQTFKFYWIQLTFPPNPIRILQIILETYINVNGNNVLPFIQTKIIKSSLFKRLHKTERKVLDEWINAQLKISNSNPNIDTTIFNQESTELNAIQREVIGKIFSQNQTSTAEYFSNKGDSEALEINTKNREKSSTIVSRSDSNDQFYQSNEDQYIVNLLTKNSKEFTAAIKDINLKLLSNPSLSETIIAEQLYLIAKQQLPNKNEIINLHAFFKNLIAHSFWYLILDYNPPSVHRNFTEFSSTQKSTISSIIQGSRTHVSQSSKVVFLSSIIRNYLIYKSTHWLIKPTFDSMTNLLVEIHTKNPKLFHAIISEPNFKNIPVDRHWNLPIKPIQEIIQIKNNSRDLINTTTSTVEANNNPIYFPIIETSWKVWQRLDTFSESLNSDLLPSVINSFIELKQANPDSVLAWLDSILSLSHINNQYQYVEFLFNKLIISQLFINPNANLTNLNNDHYLSTMYSAFDQMSTENITGIEQSVGVIYYKNLTQIIHTKNKKLLQEVELRFQDLSRFISNILTEFKLRNVHQNVAGLIEDNELTEVYNISLTKILISSTQQRSVDWFTSFFTSAEMEHLIQQTLNELQLSQSLVNSTEISVLISELERFRFLQKELTHNSRSSHKQPIYWQISTAILMDAVLKKSFDLLAMSENNTVEQIINQYTFSTIEDFFDSELLIATIAESVNSSLELIQTNFNLTSSIETSLILYWLSENLNLNSVGFEISDNPLMKKFERNSEQLPETEHIVELLVQELTELNYEAAFITDDYFKETLIPSLLLTASYANAKKIKAIINAEALTKTITRTEAFSSEENSEVTLTSEKSNPVEEIESLQSTEELPNQETGTNTENLSISLEKVDDRSSNTAAVDGSRGNADLPGNSTSIPSSIQLPYSTESIINQLFIYESDATKVLKQTFENILKSIPSLEIDKIIAKIKGTWENQIKARHIIEGHVQQSSLFKAIESIPSTKIIEIKRTEEIKQDNSAIKKAVNQGTRFATGLCGMIMLAPYYGTLFRRMNLIENNNFKSDTEQLKAYSIIFQIAKLQEETPTDYQDLVPRIIVGIPPEAGISGIIELTAEELEEIEKFLLAVKAQWKLMNNVTLRGFIQSFLLRTGKVWKEGDKWKIEVDTHGADIILKTVPWGFSFIKYPWNPYIIETKWELD